MVFLKSHGKAIGPKRTIPRDEPTQGKRPDTCLTGLLYQLWPQFPAGKIANHEECLDPDELPMNVWSVFGSGRTRISGSARCRWLSGPLTPNSE